jgi:hypothetical protein
MEKKEPYKSIRIRESYWKEIMHLSIELNKTMPETVKYLYDHYKKYDGHGILIKKGRP